MMGRRRIFRRESLTTLSAYLPDAMLIDDEQRPSETSKADTLRRIFIDYFGPEKIEEKRKEIRKKSDRQALMRNRTGDQAILTHEYPKKTYKDTVWSQADVLDIIIEGKGYTGSLAKAKALESMNKAINRGDIELDIEKGGFRIIRKYWESYLRQ